MSLKATHLATYASIMDVHNWGEGADKLICSLQPKKLERKERKEKEKQWKISENQRKSKEKSRENKGNQREIKGSQGEGEAGSQGKEEKEEKLLWKEEKVVEQPPCAATGRRRRRWVGFPTVSSRSNFSYSFWFQSQKQFVWPCIHDIMVIFLRFKSWDPKE